MKEKDEYFVRKLYIAYELKDLEYNLIYPIFLKYDCFSFVLAKVISIANYVTIDNVVLGNTTLYM